LKYRSEVFIYLEILTELYDSPMGPTRLARRVNIPYDRLPHYIDNLVAKGAVKRETLEDHEQYSLTPLGVQALSDLQKALASIVP